MGFNLLEHRNGGMVSHRGKQRFPCPVCGKDKPKSWMKRVTVVSKDPGDAGHNKETIVCRKCWRQFGQHYNDQPYSRFYLLAEGE